MNMMMTQKERKQLAEVIKRRKDCEEKIRPDNVKIIMTSIKKRLSSPALSLSRLLLELLRRRLRLISQQKREQTKRERLNNSNSDWRGEKE